MKKRTIGAAIAGLALASQLAFAATSEASETSGAPRISGTDSKFLVIAHRGFSYAAPENTIPAMTAAADAGADMVEIDVQRTKDHQLVVLHDKTLFRTTNVAKVFPTRAHDPVGSFTLAEIKKLDAGSWKSARFAGTRVPTFGELLAGLDPTSTGLLLELKNPSLYPGYEKQVAQVLSAHQFIQNHRVYVHSFSAQSLRAFHTAAPTVPLGLISNSTPKSLAGDTWMQTFNPLATSVTDTTVDEAQADHLKVFTWMNKKTPDTAAELEKLSDAGVDGVISNRPDLARAELASSIPSSASAQ